MKNSIKELRARHQLTQEDLAHKVGVSRQTINAIEKGKFDPSLPWLLNWANWFTPQLRVYLPMNQL